MIKRLDWLQIMMIIFVLTIIPVAIIFARIEIGKVDQGRVIEYDKEKGLVTLIKDMRADPGNPDYSELPPLTYEIPKKRGEMGPEPKAGYRMKLDPEKTEITIFDPATQNFKTISYSSIDRKEKIAPYDPLVKDKRFPIVDREKKTITIYSKRLKTLETFTVPDEYFALPDKTWDAGDEVRIYYKEEGKALRLMNITKTDIYKK